MFSTEEYLTTWAIYLLSAAGLMVVWWYMTKLLPIAIVRNMLRVSAAVALVMPYPVPEQEAFLAPAVMMTFLEGLFFEEQGFSHAGIPLLIAVVLANVVYLIIDLTLSALRGGKGEKAEITPAASAKPDQQTKERKTPTISV